MRITHLRVSTRLTDILWMSLYRIFWFSGNTHIIWLDVIYGCLRSNTLTAVDWHCSHSNAMALSAMQWLFQRCNGFLSDAVALSAMQWLSQRCNGSLGNAMVVLEYEHTSPWSDVGRVRFYMYLYLRQMISRHSVAFDQRLKSKSWKNLAIYSCHVKVSSNSVHCCFFKHMYEWRSFYLRAIYGSQLGKYKIPPSCISHLLRLAGNLEDHVTIFSTFVDLNDPSCTQRKLLVF